MDNNKNRTIFIDGHVHLYDNFDPDSFISSITDNFNRYAKSKDHIYSDAAKMIFLTESKDNDFFGRIEDNSLPIKNLDIHSEKTGEKGSLLLKQNGNDLFYIIKGRQIVTKENLEILSIGPSSAKIEDGLPAFEVLELIKEQNDIAILAWGVGKWLFKRGEIVKNILETFDYPLLLVGDNSARPSVWLKPFIYRKADKSGIPIVNGSDPLPLEGESQRAGSYFFMVKGKFDSDKPMRSVKEILSSDSNRLKFFGERDSLLTFCKRQSKILLKKYT